MTSTALTRRTLLGFALGLAAPGIITPAYAGIFTDTSGLGSGRFVWQPRLAPSGPLLILVAPAEQTLHIYRGAERIGISTCRIGATAPLPFGLFALIDQTRRSAAKGEDSRYSWRVAASHAESLGKPANAALPIRLPRDLAALLADATRFGATVAIAPRRTVPQIVSSNIGASGAMLADIARRVNRNPEIDDVMGAEAHIVVSAATRTASLIRGGEVKATAPVAITDPERPLGTHLYAMNAAGDFGLRWLAVAMAQKGDATHLAGDPAATLGRVVFEPGSARDEIFSAIGSRTALLLTDTANSPATRLAAPGLELCANSDPQPVASPPRVADKPQRRAHVTRRTSTRTAEGNEPLEAPRPARIFDSY